MPSESERASEPATTEPAASAPKPPPFKRGAPTLNTPSLQKALTTPPTLLFNDVGDDAAMCDPNDPDCEIA